MLPGIRGTLFPGRYLRDRLEVDARLEREAETIEERRRHFLRWWKRVEDTCGPASGIRALFDLVAMPFFGMLGYRAREASWHRGHAHARLVTPAGTPISLVVLPWSGHASAIWRDVAAAARQDSSRWGFVVSPPFVSLVDVRGSATRRGIDFALPDALDARSFRSLWTIARATSFDMAAGRIGVDALVAAATRYQDGVRTDLQRGVEAALAEITRVAGAGARGVQFDEALTIVYRVLFLLFAESRDLVPRDHPIYERGYSVATLVREALVDQDSRGAWEALAAITRLSRLGCRTDDLIVHPFNGRLFSRRAAPSLEDRRIRTRRGRTADDRDRAMRRALIALGSRPGRAGREEIAYADLGVEQLGAVYERLLDLPKMTPGVIFESRRRKSRPASFSASFSRHSPRRKQTGTFYTPQALAEFVVRRTLAPLVEAIPADAILSLRVVDPAMGSGAFLVAACRYLAAAYERALVAEGRAAPTDLNDHERARLRRLVAERCLAGVDVNPVAVQLARLSLWLTTLAEGRPLTFLDHRLRIGNSLIGASPEDLSRVDALRASGDGPLPLFDAAGLDHSMRETLRPLAGLIHQPDETVADVRAKERTWERLTSPASPLAPWRLAADAWCARWCRARGASRWSAAETAAILAAVLRNDRTLPPSHIARRLSDIADARRVHTFFHWPLEFSEVFYDETGHPRERPGFDAIIGNPPWEMLRHDDRAEEDSEHAQEEAVRFIRDSGIYRSCGRGHLNLYQPFLERSLALCRDGGRIGLVLPWGFASDDGAAALRRRLIERGMLDTIVGLDNADGLFPIHRGVRFAVIVCAPGRPAADVRARFGVKTADELETLPGRDTSGQSAWPVRLDANSLRKIGGPSLRLPDARRAEDLRLVEGWMDRFPPLGQADGWGAEFGRELNASDDRESFGPDGLPVVEGKHLEPFRVRTGDATRRVPRGEALRLLPDARFAHPRLGYRDVSSVSNTRSLIAAVLPADVVTTHTIFCLRTPVPIAASHFLCALFNSFVLNTIVRLLMGGHVTTSLVEHLPVPPWNASRHQRRIARLAARLTVQARREPVAARVEAEVAALYGVDAADFQRIADGFPLVMAELKARSVRELMNMKLDEAGQRAKGRGQRTGKK